MTTSEVRHNYADPLWQPETGCHRSDTPKGGCFGACVADDNESPVRRSHAHGEEEGEAVYQEGRPGDAEKCQEEHQKARQNECEEEGQQAQGREEHQEEGCQAQGKEKGHQENSRDNQWRAEREKIHPTQGQKAQIRRWATVDKKSNGPDASSRASGFFFVCPSTFVTLGTLICQDGKSVAASSPLPQKDLRHMAAMIFRRLTQPLSAERGRYFGHFHPPP
jgi:hypothetical protein